MWENSTRNFTCCFKTTGTFHLLGISLFFVSLLCTCGTVFSQWTKKPRV